MRRYPISPLLRGAAACAFAVWVALVSGLTGGCLMQPTFQASVTTADGVKVDYPLNSTQEVTVTEGPVTVKKFVFAPWDMGPDKPKRITFSFIATFQNNATPTSIVVTDVTEDPILEIFADKKPILIKGVWAGLSIPYAPQDEHVNWVLNLDNNVRVYRFTVGLADGSTHVLYKPVFVPAQMKSVMRLQLGLK